MWMARRLFIQVSLVVGLTIGISSVLHADDDARASLRSSAATSPSIEYSEVITDESLIPEEMRFKKIRVSSTNKNEALQALAKRGISFEQKEKRQPTKAEAYAFLASIFRIPEHNKHLIPRMVTAMERRKQGLQSLEAQKRREFLSSKGVVQHLRFQEGESFPPESEQRRDLLSSEQMKLMGNILAQVAERKTVSDQTEKNLDIQSEKIMTTVRARALPPCLEGKTLRIKKPKKKKNIFSELYQKEEKEDVFDHLFLSPNAPNLRTGYIDIEELFGEHVQIHRYTTEPGDRTSLLASSGKAACLPFRLRAQGDFIYRDYGENALMHFSEGFHKKGVLHPKIEKELDEFF